MCEHLVESHAGQLQLTDEELFRLEQQVAGLETELQNSDGGGCGESFVLDSLTVFHIQNLQDLSTAHTGMERTGGQPGTLDSSQMYHQGVDCLLQMCIKVLRC